MQGQIGKLSGGRDAVVMGEFQYLDIDWESHTACSARAASFLNCLEEGFFEQFVKVGTRETTSWTWCLKTEVTWWSRLTSTAPSEQVTTT